MPKEAYRYYKQDPWTIIEQGYDKNRNQVSESIFSLANEYMGIRGVIEEGVSAETLIGSYFNGVYETGVDEGAPNYKGIVKDTHFMVNAVNWLYTRLTADGEPLDIAKSTISDFRRTLDMRKGVLKRSLDWTTKNGKTISVTFTRFLSMTDVHHGYQRIELTADTPVDIVLSTGLDFSIKHFGKENHWRTTDKKVGKREAHIQSLTKTTGLPLLSAYAYTLNVEHKSTPVDAAQFTGHELSFKLEENKKATFTKQVTNDARKKKTDTEKHLEEALKIFGAQPDYDTALDKQSSYWDTVWQTTDIEIGGDPENQQGIRFCIFQLQQTYQGVDKHNNIGAKGLTGEAYSGHAFWDTETYCLPFFLLNNRTAARNLLMFRYNTLEPAKKRARDLDCGGACYPVATLNGHEASTLWQHSNLQFQPSTAVAYAIWHYVKLTDDHDFLYEYGLEMLTEISRFLLSRGDYNQTGDKFGYYGVMGPDEFQMMVHHNAYTNYMAKETFRYTLEVTENAPRHKQDALLKEDEQKAIRKAIEHMHIPKDEATGLYEQHEGFFDLPHIDIDTIPKEDFPLYHNWSYDRIYRNDMIKQPDVLMFMFLYNQAFTLEEKRANYEYYEPRTIHESSLSPSIHSIFALELDRMDEALEFFSFATRMDLDDYNRNANEGLHTTSIAAAWMNIVYGFGGVRTDGDILKLDPKLPDIWQYYTFRIQYEGRTLEVLVEREKTIIHNDGAPLTINIKGEITTLKESLEIKRGT